MSTTTPSDVRDASLLSVGAQCEQQSCLLVDFLPFKCQHCNLRFCAEHFRPEAHSCTKYDASKFDRVAPPCPLCNEPVAVRPNEDPNIQMERHISTLCSVATGKAKTKSSPVCAKGKCRKVLIAQIRCPGCKEQFCPEHRFPADHDCAKPPAPARPSRPVVSQAGRAKLEAFKKSVANALPTASSSARPRVIPKSSTTTSSSSKPPSSGPAGNNSTAGSSGGASTSLPKVFSSTDSSLRPSSPSTSPMPSPSRFSTSSSSFTPTSPPSPSSEQTDSAHTRTESVPDSVIRRATFIPPPLFA